MLNKHTQAIAFFFILLTFASIFSLYIPKGEAQEDVLVIPNEAIRLRILANSNSDQDQEIKRVVRDRVNAQITEWVSELTSLEEARNTITSNLDQLEGIAIDVLTEYGVNQSVNIEFNEVEFPTKLYGNFLYPAGMYEAVLITIGEGQGANWWCVLFPPLCFLDFSSGSAVSEGFDEEEDKDAEAVQVNAEGTEETSQQVDEEKTEGENSQQVDTEETEEEKQQVYVEDNEDEVEVKFFVVEIFDKIKALFS